MSNSTAVKVFFFFFFLVVFLAQEFFRSLFSKEGIGKESGAEVRHPISLPRPRLKNARQSLGVDRGPDFLLCGLKHGTPPPTVAGRAFTLSVRKRRVVTGGAH